MNRWDIFRNAPNGADPNLGTSHFHQTRERDAEKAPARSREERGEYVFDRPPVRHHDESDDDHGWGARRRMHELQSFGYARDDRRLAHLYEHEHDMRFDRPYTPRDPHPSLWERVKGAFTGKGPKNWQRSDARIREDVCECLCDHAQIDATEIEVTVKGGEVTLVGLVDQRRTKRLAEDVTEEIRGVRDIHNQIKIRPH